MSSERTFLFWFSALMSLQSNLTFIFEKKVSNQQQSPITCVSVERSHKTAKLLVASKRHHTLIYEQIRFAIVYWTRRRAKLIRT